MCGRYAAFRQAQDLADDFSLVVVDPVAQELEPSWNVAPTQAVRIVVEQSLDPDGGEAGAEDDGDSRQRRLTVARWGLVPHWAKDPSIGSRMINARSETAAEKPSFRDAVAKRRCIVPADCYYEWRAPSEGGGSTKTPFAIGHPDGAPLAFAGLYSWWRVPQSDDLAGHRAVQGDWLLTCSILTRAAQGPMRELHDRVPVVLDDLRIGAWLDPGETNGPQALHGALDAEADLAWHEVSRAVNTPRNNGPRLIAPVDGAEVGHS